MSQLRADRVGAHRVALQKNRKTILASQDVCGICNGLVDKRLKPPHPMAPCVDHIVPINRGGHPSALENLQLAHWTCNRQKSDKILKADSNVAEVGNRNLPHSRNWLIYKG